MMTTVSPQLLNYRKCVHLTSLLLRFEALDFITVYVPLSGHWSAAHKQMLIVIALLDIGSSVRYLRIGSLISDEPFLHLQEIEVYGADGENMPPIGAEMSSTYEANTVDRCFDGDTTTIAQLCATKLKGHEDADPWLRVDYGEGVVIRRIVVTNRVDCCQSRINGATISLTNDRDGKDVVWSATFDGTTTKYTFRPMSPLPSYPPTRLPTGSPLKLLPQPTIPMPETCPVGSPRPSFAVARDCTTSCTSGSNRFWQACQTQSFIDNRFEGFQIERIKKPTPTVSAVEASTGGDGFVPIVDTFGRVFNIFRSTEGTLSCTDMKTGEACKGFPASKLWKGLSSFTISDAATGYLSPGAGSEPPRIWQPAIRKLGSESWHVFICIDVPFGQIPRLCNSGATRTGEAGYLSASFVAKGWREDSQFGHGYPDYDRKRLYAHAMSTGELHCIDLQDHKKAQLCDGFPFFVRGKPSSDGGALFNAIRVYPMPLTSKVMYAGAGRNTAGEAQLMLGCIDIANRDGMVCDGWPSRGNVIEASGPVCQGCSNPFKGLARGLGSTDGYVAGLWPILGPTGEAEAVCMFTTSSAIERAHHHMNCFHLANGKHVHTDRQAPVTGTDNAALALDYMRSVAGTRRNNAWYGGGGGHFGTRAYVVVDDGEAGTRSGFSVNQLIICWDAATKAGCANFNEQNGQFNVNGGNYGFMVDPGFDGKGSCLWTLGRGGRLLSHNTVNPGPKDDRNPCPIVQQPFPIEVTPFVVPCVGGNIKSSWGSVEIANNGSTYDEIVVAVQDTTGLQLIKRTLTPDRPKSQIFDDHTVIRANASRLTFVTEMREIIDDTRFDADPFLALKVTWALDGTTLCQPCCDDVSIDTVVDDVCCGLQLAPGVSPTPLIEETTTQEIVTEANSQQTTSSSESDSVRCDRWYVVVVFSKRCYINLYTWQSGY